MSKADFDIKLAGGVSAPLFKESMPRLPMETLRKGINISDVREYDVLNFLICHIMFFFKSYPSSIFMKHGYRYGVLIGYDMDMGILKSLE